MNYFLPIALLFVILASGCTTQANPQTTGPDNSAPLDEGYSMAQVSIHNQAADCWLVINAKVYDVSNYTRHPGGDAYVPYCGKDASVAFATKGDKGEPHSQKAQNALAQFEIGPLLP